MHWMDGIDAVLGRLKEKEALYAAIAACFRHAATGSQSSLAAVADTWQLIASFLLPPVPQQVDHLRIPMNLEHAEVVAVEEAVSRWGSCIQERVEKERNLSAEEFAMWEHGDANAYTLAKLLLLRDQCIRTELLLEQLELPHVDHVFTWVQAQGDGCMGAAERTGAWKDSLTRFHVEAMERSQSLANCLQGEQEHLAGRIPEGGCLPECKSEEPKLLLLLLLLLAA
eukprot:CAMPEP_0171103910 /NCGR_PEP_ID=MMETSP0766_2-20121228/59635_1 /TAXON_ID=439317 /ORGANISM="Gambierdiscus australes, Strain CAWD 149" /LENGTH=225 /DNA_ID=CAMNT_0011564425 /DNA_START=36 /DNA_END=710 /DNA_ORIENTATION=+